MDRRFIGFVVGLAFLSFVAGTAVATFNRFPYPGMYRAFQGLQALWFEYKKSRAPYETLWFPAWTADTGVVVRDAQRSFAGLTLVSTRAEPGALLLDMDGQVRHRWSVPYSRLREPGAGECRDEFVFWDNVRAFPDGDLLAVLICPDRTPWGLGIVRLDRESHVRWKYLGAAHHDLDIAPDGRIYALTHEIVDGVPPGLAPQIRGPLTQDFLVVLSPDGHELRKVAVLAAVARSPFAGIVRPFPTGDLLHTNGVRLVTPQIARAFPFARPGQVLLSFAAISSLGVLDLDAGTLTWFARGQWGGQHDPDFLDNGHLLLFDNTGTVAYTQRSRVIEIDPATLGITWSYAGAGLPRFFSATMSSQQRLPNGNTLITSSEEGRLLEVTPAGEVAWEWIAPERVRYRGADKLPAVRSAIRYRREELPFLAAGAEPQRP